MSWQRRTVPLTCPPGGAAGALGLWGDPFEERVGVDQVSSYHDLKEVDEAISIDSWLFWDHC